jgi:hypothetical protein
MGTKEPKEINILAVTLFSIFGGIAVALICLYVASANYEDTFDYDKVYKSHRPPVKLCVDGILYHKIRNYVIPIVDVTTQKYKSCDMNTAHPVSLE